MANNNYAFQKKLLKAMLIGLTGTFLVTGCGSDSNSSTSPVEQSDSAAKKSAAENLGEHWIKDDNNVYVYNPKPQKGETITWSGGFVQDGENKFADGAGTVTWYLNGELEQIDEGTMKHGQRHGQFKQEFFPSGNVTYSNWDNGIEIPTVDPKTAEINAAKTAFINYHKAITNKNYREAYETLSYKQRERVGDYDSWVKGFADTITSEVSSMTLTSSEEGVHSFNYTLTARDRHAVGNIKVQVFEGQVTMAEDKGRWYVRYAKSNRVDEKIVAEHEKEQKIKLASEQKKREEKLTNTSAEKDLEKITSTVNNSSTKDYLETIQPFALADLVQKATGIVGLFQEGSTAGLENYIMAMTLLADNERSRNTAISRDVARYFEYEAQIAAAYAVMKNMGIVEKAATGYIIYQLNQEENEVENKIRKVAEDCGADLSSYAVTETVRRIVNVVKSLR